jgi:hypothetical protein
MPALNLFILYGCFSAETHTDPAQKIKGKKDVDFR